ncbi:MAG: sigma-70 family RNA polymerase sigma factor [Anaerolineae bacterium]|nr:sigma-70 family RNA polymerase sigma factor [Anaerolineae bacterium]
MDLFVLLLDSLNETLATGIVILAASILLYNVTRNLRNRVARTSAVVLGCVTIAYIGDVFISLEPGVAAHEVALRLQWVGIAFVPAAVFHLSDALLATTGLPSRGRRRRVARILYGISAAFLLAAAFTNILVDPVILSSQITHAGQAVGLRAGPLFPVYMAYFLVAMIVAFINVHRARMRCLTRSTRRRMGYLQFALVTPAIGLFPFSVVLGAGTEYTFLGLLLVNLANIGVILLLLFLAYPLSFFGSSIPDRAVKIELLRFILRGPITGMLALGTYIFTNTTSQILGLQGEQFAPFAIVAVILFWQWLIALILPYLERRLVYGDEEFDQLAKLQDLSERLLTENDLIQLIDATLASLCDYLRVDTAFIAAFNQNSIDLVSAVGPNAPETTALSENAAQVRKLAAQKTSDAPAQSWQDYWLVPLEAQRRTNGGSAIGMLGFQARGETVDLSEDEQATLGVFARRAAQALEDMALQNELYAALEGLLPQIHLNRRSTVEIEFRPGRTPSLPATNRIIEDREQFNDQVRAALRHYWGGPGLTKSRLLELSVVQSALEANDSNAVNALRAVLSEAIDMLRPEGERKPLSPEWTLYSILELRYLKGLKVREVAHRLALSEPDFYRKQRLAIDMIADVLWDMERSRQSQT